MGQTNDNSFTLDKQSPIQDNLFGEFEDDGETGYLYLYEEDGAGIIKYLRIYDHNPDLLVNEQDVEVVWAADGSKCEVKICGGIRGIIDISKTKEEMIAG